MGSEIATKVLSITAAALQAVDRVADHAEAVLGRNHTVDQLADIAKTLVAVVNAVRDGLKSPATAEAVQAALNGLVTGISSNNATVDDMIDAKFPQG